MAALERQVTDEEYDEYQENKELFLLTHRAVLVKRLDETYPGCIYYEEKAGMSAAARAQAFANATTHDELTPDEANLVEVLVAPALASATEEIGPLVTDAVRDAQEKAAALAAHEFGRAAEDFNLPIPAESLRGLLGGAS